MSYFVYLMPDETGLTYDKVQKTVEYTLHLTKINSGIIGWFKELFNKQNEEQAETFSQKTLGVGCPLGLDSIFGDDDESIIPKNDLHNTKELFEWLKENLAVEGDIIVNDHSIIINSTLEFDWQYSFFEIQAVINEELGKYLNPLIKIDAKGDVVLIQNKVILSAYL